MDIFRICVVFCDVSFVNNFERVCMSSNITEEARIFHKFSYYYLLWLQLRLFENLANQAAIDRMKSKYLVIPFFHSPLLKRSIKVRWACIPSVCVWCNMEFYLPLVCLHCQILCCHRNLLPGPKTLFLDRYYFHRHVCVCLFAFLWVSLYLNYLKRFVINFDETWQDDAI